MQSKPQIITFPAIADARGDLSFANFEAHIPFKVKRTYWIGKMPEGQERGGHAHKTDIQLILCLQGSAQVWLESLKGEALEFELKNPNQGLLIPPMWWGRMVFKDKAILLGFSSNEFSESDYIRVKSEFK